MTDIIVVVQESLDIHLWVLAIPSPVLLHQTIELLKRKTYRGYLSHCLMKKVFP